MYIKEGAPQPERLRELNQIAIQQLKLLTDHASIRQLKGKEE